MFDEKPVSRDMTFNTSIDIITQQTQTHSKRSVNSYKLCLPIILLGNNATVMTQPSVTPPAKYNTLFASFPPPLPYKCCAINGLTIPNNLPQKLAKPHAVPLIGAGNASGVQPYKTALNMLWKKYSMTFSPMLLAAEFTVLKTKMEVAIRAADIIIVYLRPMREER